MLTTSQEEKKSVENKKQRTFNENTVVAKNDWGFVDSSGIVWVKDTLGIRECGKTFGLDPKKALDIFNGKYDELKTSLLLFSRSFNQLSMSRLTHSVEYFDKELQAPSVVGDIEALRKIFQELKDKTPEQIQSIREKNIESKENAKLEYEEIVQTMESIANTDRDQINWKFVNEKIDNLRDRWRAVKQDYSRISKEQETQLWNRFNTAQKLFKVKRNERSSELKIARENASAEKEKIIAKAQKIVDSKEWDKTAKEFAELMRQWRNAGRADKRIDEKLWKTFKELQDTFFSTKNESVQQEISQENENLEKKLALIEKMEALLPVEDKTNSEFKKANQELNSLRDSFFEIGRVPKDSVRSVQKRLDDVFNVFFEKKNATNQNEDSKEKKQDRVTGFKAELELKIQKMEQQLEEAKKSNNKQEIKTLEESLKVRKVWLNGL